MNCEQPLRDRVTWAIDFAWSITLNKIANGEVKVNKEASLQMQYASVLKSVLDLIRYSTRDRIDIELETTVKIQSKQYIVDIMLLYTDGNVSERHSIELKCYKKLAYSGNKRGAQDIFMYKVYLDLFYSELYLNCSIADSCTCLILTDYDYFVTPKSKKSKNWAYDISNSHSFVGGHFKTPIAGEAVDFKLNGSYQFNWTKRGSYWGTIIRPL